MKNKLLTISDQGEWESEDLCGSRRVLHLGDGGGGGVGGGDDGGDSEKKTVQDSTVKTQY